MSELTPQTVALVAAGIKYRERLGELRPAFEALAAVVVRTVDALAPFCRWLDQPEVQKQLRRRKIDQRRVGQQMRYVRQRAARRARRATP